MRSFITEINLTDQIIEGSHSIRPLLHPGESAPILSNLGAETVATSAPDQGNGTCNKSALVRTVALKRIVQNPGFHPYRRLPKSFQGRYVSILLNSHRHDYVEDELRGLDCRQR
jgi:hypothetical protein